MSPQIRWQDYIVEDKNILFGKPAFKGTRLSVDFILRRMASGMTNAEMLDQYPTLRPEHMTAALMYAADMVSKYFEDKQRKPE